jgi:hypothetical protein
MLQIDTLSSLALSIDDVCALDYTRLSNVTRFREFAAGISVTPAFMTQARWQNTGPNGGTDAVFGFIMHEMLPEVFDIDVLAQKGPFGIRITGIGDFTVAAINLRMVVFKGLPLDMMKDTELIDFEIAPDAFMAYCRGLMLAVAEEILEDDDEAEDRPISDFELEMIGMPAGGGDCMRENCGGYQPPDDELGGPKPSADNRSDGVNVKFTTDQIAALTQAKRYADEVTGYIKDGLINNNNQKTDEANINYEQAKQSLEGWAKWTLKANELFVKLPEETVTNATKYSEGAADRELNIRDAIDNLKVAIYKTMPPADHATKTSTGDGTSCQTNMIKGNGCGANQSSCVSNLSSGGVCGANASFCGNNASVDTACGGNGSACGNNFSIGTGCAANANACGGNTSGLTGCGSNVGACGAKAALDAVCAVNASACGANASLGSACAVNAGASAVGACAANLCVINVGNTDLISACLVNIIPLLPSC